MWNLSYERFDWLYDIFSHVKKVVWAFWLAAIFLPKKFNTCSQANVNMESGFVNLLRREIYDILSTKNLGRSWRNTFVVLLRWNKPRLYFLHENKSLNGKNICFYISLVFCCPSVSSKSRYYKERQVDRKKRKAIRRWFVMIRHGRHVLSQCPKQRHIPPVLVNIF